MTQSVILYASLIASVCVFTYQMSGMRKLNYAQQNRGLKAKCNVNFFCEVQKVAVPVYLGARFIYIILMAYVLSVPFYFTITFAERF